MRLGECIGYWMGVYRRVCNIGGEEFFVIVPETSDYGLGRHVEEARVYFSSVHLSFNSIYGVLQAGNRMALYFQRDEWCPYVFCGMSFGNQLYTAWHRASFVQKFLESPVEKLSTFSQAVF